MNKTYQAVLLIPESVLNDMQERITKLESNDKCNTLSFNNNNTLATKDNTISYKDAALQLGIAEQSLTRSRNSGRISGFKIDGRAYGYLQSEIDRYKKEKGRNKESE